MSRRSLLIGTVLVGLCVFAGAAAAAPRGTVKTGLAFYTPFSGASVAKGVRVKRTLHGACLATSAADAGAAHAYRCVAKKHAYDPCFAPAAGSATFVLCPISFPGSPVTRILLGRKLPAGRTSPDPDHFRPWALVLANGKRCTTSRALAGPRSGPSIHYACLGGGVLFRDPTRRKRTWTIRYSRKSTRASLHRVAIRTAWW